MNGRSLNQIDVFLDSLLVMDSYLHNTRITFFAVFGNQVQHPMNANATLLKHKMLRGGSMMPAKQSPFRREGGTASAA